MLATREFKHVQDRLLAAIVLGFNLRENRDLEQAAGISMEALSRELEVPPLDVARLPEPCTSHTAVHERRVTQLCLAIAERMRRPAAAMEQLCLAAMVHDIGKTAVPTEILMKPGPLTAEEFELLRTHPQKAYVALIGIGFPARVAEIVAQHHERLDGSGYPLGLRGGEILMEARILAVADVVEAMHSHRPYRPAPGMQAALREIETGMGSRYDASAASACIALFRTGGFAFEVESPPDEIQT